MKTNRTMKVSSAEELLASLADMEPGQSAKVLQEALGRTLAYLDDDQRSQVLLGLTGGPNADKLMSMVHL